jgi:acylphosphatase
MLQLSFTVHGKVQGVFFRKYTAAEATKLGLTGWCKNTQEGTVVGVIEGERKEIDKMKVWLREKGSPKSRIDKAVFSDATEIEEREFASFEIDRS